MRWIALTCLLVPALAAQDAREIIRKSVELDQANWLRMRDYTWIAQETTRSLDSKGRVKSSDSDKWETVVLFGEPHRRMLERNGKPLTEADQHKEQLKLDKVVAKLGAETEAQRQHRLEQLERERQKDREFLLEVCDLYDLKIVSEQKIDGRDTWEISATPKPGYEPKRRDARPLLKIQGKIWIDQAEYQWVRIEAETTGTISYGLFLARLNAGAKLLFEQTRVNDEIWLPKFEHVSGSGRLGLVKKIVEEQDLTWSNYRKFQVESKILSTQ